MTAFVHAGLKIAQTPGVDCLVVTRMNRDPECMPREFDSYCIRGLGPAYVRLSDWLVGKEMTGDCYVNYARIIEFQNASDRAEMERQFSDYIRDYPSMDEVLQEHENRVNAKSA